MNIKKNEVLDVLRKLWERGKVNKFTENDNDKKKFVPPIFV